MSQDYDDEYGDENEAGREEGQEEFRPGDAAAMQRTNVPGILLIILGVLNLLGCGYLCFNGIFVLTAGKDMAISRRLEIQCSDRR